MSEKAILNVFCLSDEDVELEQGEREAQDEADGLEGANIVAD